MAQITCTEEQAMLLETAASFCRDKSPVAKVRHDIDALAAHDDMLWREMAELGWLGITVPEEFGGLGLGLEGAVPVAEAMGRYLLASPFLASTLAIQALVDNGSRAQQEQWLPRLAGGSIATLALTEQEGDWQLGEITAAGVRRGDALILSGSKTFVLDALSAELLIASVLVDGVPRLVLVEGAQLDEGAIKRQVVIDETRRSYDVQLDGVAVSEDALLPRADLDALERAAMLLLSAEAAGGLVGVLHTIVDYLNTRKQFDRLIGSYQALKHPTVDILLAAEAARSHVYHAATVCGTGAGAEGAIRMAKAHCSEAFAYAGDRAVQFHGGFGFTYECDAQLYLRRALWCQYQFGDERHQRARLAPLLLDEGES